MAGPKLLLFGTNQLGPGTIYGGIRIAQGALQHLPELCVLAVTDATGIGELTRAERFDHVRLSRPGSTVATLGLRQRLIRDILRSYEPDIVVALRCSAGPNSELLEPLAEERERRPELQTALALWDVPTDAEIEALGSQPVLFNQLFDEVWSFGDPTVHNRRDDLPARLTHNLVDLGYATAGLATPLMVVPGTNQTINISLDLGSGWLSESAIDALRLGLNQPSLEGAKIELLPNPVLDSRTTNELATKLGVMVGPSGTPTRTSQGLRVTTGGYNSVCAALTSGRVPLIIHDSRSSSVRRRANALADSGVCSTVDLTASEPFELADEMLRLIEESSVRPTISVDGVSLASERMTGLLSGAASYTPSSA